MCVLIVMHGRGRIDHGPSHPYSAGTEHVRLSPTSQRWLAPSTKRREVLGEFQQGGDASY